MRSSRPARAFAGACLSACLVVSASTAALPAPAGPQPVITHAPQRVGFSTTAIITGRLDNGAPGDTVALQQRRSDTDWRTVAEKPVDENLEVRFARHELRRTTTFRLAHTDAISGVDAMSEHHRVRVRSVLTSHLSRRHVFAGATVRIRGRLRPARPHRRVVIQQKVAGEWRYLKKVVVDEAGYYRARFSAEVSGHRKVRAVFRGDADSTRSTAARVLTVYRRDLATWYGPGFYGNRTACGRTLTTETLGVAHRTLPCGTGVSILYKGRTITVPVIDRGPYTSARWDLTSATARRLRFSGKEQIGVTH